MYNNRNSTSVNWLESGSSRNIPRRPMTDESPMPESPPRPAQTVGHAGAGTPGPAAQDDGAPSDMVRFCQGPPPVTDRWYIPGYLMENIGSMIRAEFYVGSAMYTDRVGKLLEVGVNYFVLEEVISGNRVMCDLYSVKFVTFVSR